MGLVVHVQRGWQLRLSGHSPLEQWAAPSFFLFPIFSDRITGRWTAVYLSCSAACLYYRFVFDGFSNGREKIIRRWDDERFFFLFFFKFTSKQNDGKVEAASIGPIDWIVVSLLYTHPLSSSFPPVIILSFDAGSTVVV